MSERVGRLFLGIPLPHDVREALRRHLDGAAGALPGRAVQPASWHLTLRFLGDTDADAHRRLAAELRAANPGRAFALGFGRLGAFPKPRRAAVLWMGVEEGAREIAALAGEVEAAARRAGFAAEEKRFSPHLTLSRIQPPRDVSALVERVPAFPARMDVDAAVLFRSHLGGGPPRYEALERFPLAAG